MKPHHYNTNFCHTATCISKQIIACMHLLPENLLSNLAAELASRDNPHHPLCPDGSGYLQFKFCLLSFLILEMSELPVPSLQHEVGGRKPLSYLRTRSLPSIQSDRSNVIIWHYLKYNVLVSITKG